MLSALIGYAAVTLAFAGGIHWGFELQSRQQDRFVERARLGLGIVPPLVGWIALLLPLVVRILGLAHRADRCLYRRGAGGAGGGEA